MKDEKQKKHDLTSEMIKWLCVIQNSSALQRPFKRVRYDKLWSLKSNIINLNVGMIILHLYQVPRWEVILKKILWTE